MLNAIPRGSCAMDFCCKGPGNEGELASVARQHGARVVHCPFGPTHFQFARELGRLLKDGDYQILHSHVELYSGFPVWIAHGLGIPVITSFHNTYFPPQHGWGKKLVLRQLRSMYGAASISYALRHSDLVTGCSQAVLESVGCQGDRFGTPSRVLYYGVPFPELATPEDRSVLRASLGWGSDTPLILHVGRFIEQKNHIGLLTVFERVLQAIPKAKLLLVGDGMLRPAVERAVTARGLSSSVRLLGFRDDASALMRRCDVLLLPSFHEGLPMVAIEAGAAGLPVVGSRIPGLSEAVRDGVTAMLHDVDDIDKLAHSVIHFLSDRQFARRTGCAARSWAKEKFSIEASAGKLLDTYRRYMRPW